MVHFLPFQGASLVKENETLRDKINDFKDTLEKNDKKERLRESNEKIVSLKIQLSVSIDSLIFEIFCSALLAASI